MKQNYRLLALLVLPVLILVWHCQSDVRSGNEHIEKINTIMDSINCIQKPLSSGDSSFYDPIMMNPFTMEPDNYFACRKDYYAYDSLYLYRYWFLRRVNITCAVYKEKQRWIADMYYYKHFGPGKPDKVFISKELPQQVIDTFQQRLTDMNYLCLPGWLDTIEMEKRGIRPNGLELSSMMAINCSGKQRYYRWRALDSDRYYREVQHKPEAQIRSAIAYLLSNASLPKPEIHLFAFTNSKKDSIGVYIELSEDLLIDRELQWKADTSITLRFEEGKDFQRIHKSKAHLLDSISVEVLLYTGERYWLRPPKIHWYY